MRPAATALCLGLLLAAASPALDLTHAVVVAPASLTRPESKAVTLLIEEVEKRTQIRWPTAASAAAGRSAIVLARSAPGSPAEGFSLRVEPARVVITGNDARGLLFGCGRLLRELHMSRGAVSVPGDFRLTTAPHYPLRGHQLGYRPKTNSYDGWSLPMWEQYIRDLAVFGTNAVELIPPRSDDDADSPHFPLPPMETMTGMSKLAADYGLDVWIWYPAMDEDYSKPQTVDFALREWGDVFQKLPRVDAVFVPGGDPGHTPPQHLLALLEKQTQNLHRYHPKAQMWVSPQGFSKEWLDEFLGLLRRDQPRWLSGVVFGPQVRMSLPELRAAVPRQYPIRHYPDITHSRQSQYPVPNWDPAFALTEAREVINPRPLGEARIFRLLQPHTVGFLAYSEGCNDDVNKIVWSALGWNPDADVNEILRQYSRYFIGDGYTDRFARGLLALERNWEGALSTNAGVRETLTDFQALERAAAPRDRLNWRFQQALYRAYYDAYLAERLAFETQAETAALDRLRAAPQTGSLRAIDEAEAILDRPVALRAADPRRARVFELAEALFQSIRMQLSVERYQAIAVGRGANLDTIDAPLNNRLWLERRFQELRGLPDEPARLRSLAEIVHRTDPGPGGFYDDLGQPGRQPHLVPGPGFDSDPASLQSPLLSISSQADLPYSWMTFAETLNETPLQMRYTGLDRAASYKVRVVYAIEAPRPRVSLEANGMEIHPFLAKPSPPAPLEFAIPAAATAGGELTLTWRREPGVAGNGRGCQVAEVWLIRQPAAAGVR